jgi:guanylate kinase
VSILLVVSGPSGAGKGTIVQGLLARDPDLWVSVSWTSRSPREGEIEGVHYHFVSRDEFLAHRDAGGFLEWFEVHGDLKGTPRGPVREHLDAGADVLLEIDVQGALEVRRQFPEALLVFVLPPSREEQRRRLVGRGTDSPDAIERRLADAMAEDAKGVLFDATVVNDDVDAAVARVAGILASRRANR